MARKGSHCLLGCIISFVSVLVLIVVIGVVLINLTPRQLGFADVKLGDQTLDEMGLGDINILSLIKSFRGLTKVDESEIVTNPYNAAAEQGNAQAAFDNGSLSDADNYSSLAEEKVVYDKQYLLEYKDSTLAYIADNIVQNSTDEESALTTLKNAKMSIAEITITVADGKGALRVVCCLELGEYTSQIEEKIGALKSLIKIPEKIFVVSTLSFTVNDEGKLETTSDSININGNNDDPVSKAIMSIVLGKIGDDASLDDLNGKIGEAISEVMLNLGKIGTASVNLHGEVQGNIVYGMGGVSEHTITVITYTD